MDYSTQPLTIPPIGRIQARTGVDPARHAWWRELGAHFTCVMRGRCSGDRRSLEEVGDFRARARLGICVAALFLLIPFAINHMVNGAIFLGLGVVVIVAMAICNVWSILRGRGVGWMIPAALVPVVSAFLMICFRQQGMVAVFWTYPALVSFYILLPPTQARVSNLVFLAVIIPEAMKVLAPDLMIRFGATLLAVSIFTAILVSTFTRQERQLRRTAVTDQLTGLLNRKMLRSALDEAVQLSRRYASPMTLLSLDLDQFKAINDSFGHDAGDAVLRSVGTTLRNRLRGSDQVFRVGGEEFLAVLYDTDSEQGSQVADDLRRRIATLDLLPERRVTASLGVASLRPGESWESWVKRADSQLYRAKSAGRNRVVVERRRAQEAGHSSFTEGALW